MSQAAQATFPLPLPGTGLMLNAGQTMGYGLNVSNLTVCGVPPAEGREPAASVAAERFGRRVFARALVERSIRREGTGCRAGFC